MVIWKKLNIELKDYFIFLIFFGNFFIIKILNFEHLIFL